MDHPRPGLRYVDASDLDNSEFHFDGMEVKGLDHEKLGKVDGFIIDKSSGHPYYVAVECGRLVQVEVLSAADRPRRDGADGEQPRGGHDARPGERVSGIRSRRVQEADGRRAEDDGRSDVRRVLYRRDDRHRLAVPLPARPLPVSRLVGCELRPSRSGGYAGQRNCRHEALAFVAKYCFVARGRCVIFFRCSFPGGSFRWSARLPAPAVFR